MDRVARQGVPPRQTGYCVPQVLRTASCPASMAGPIAVRSTQFGEGEHVVFAGDSVPKTLALFLKQSTKGIAVLL